MRPHSLPAVLVSVLALALASAVLAPPAEASPYVRYGIQDDAWLMFGPGSMEDRVRTFKALGADVVRITLRWHEVAPTKPRNPRNPHDPAYQWNAYGEVLERLNANGLRAVVTLWGTPRWANGGRAPNFAPGSKWAFANFAYAAQTRFPWVRDWTIWNEPNKRMFLRPTSAQVYTKRLLNPAYRTLHLANRRARVAGGVTGPRGGIGGVSPVAWIRGMDRAGARLDAYAHNPYPLRPRQETPASGGCGHCRTITLATLDRLLGEVRRAFGRTRIWLTEYGYQTNPPSRQLGVSEARQAQYVGEAALRVRRAPRVDMLVHFMYRDDTRLAGWQSGLVHMDGREKVGHQAFRFSLAQSSRRGLRTVLWGQIRPRSGRQPYRLQRHRNGRWVWVGTAKRTNARGMFQRAIRAQPGEWIRVYSPRDGEFGAPIRIR